MVIVPLGLQSGNYGVELLAQTSRSSLIQSQQTAQMSEILKDNQRKAQEIQPGEEILSTERIHRKTDDEQQEHRGRDQEENKRKTAQQDEEVQKTTLSAIQKNGRYDFYI